MQAQSGSTDPAIVRSVPPALPRWEAYPPSAREPDDTPLFSPHAGLRAAQRNVSQEAILFVIQHAHRVRRAGVIFCQLRAKDLPRYLPANHQYRNLVGTTVVLCRCGQYVVTVYRAAKAFHADNCKAKYNAQPDRTDCPYCASSPQARPA